MAEKKQGKSSYVGIITLFKNNYGSTLQCYALKHCVEKLGYSCIVIEKNNGGFAGKVNSVINKFRLIYRSVFYKGYFDEKVKMKKAMKIESQLLNGKSKALINRFIEKEISPISLNRKELKKIGNNNDYKAFIVGSDQVWNASRNIDDFYFLKFAKKNKRKTYAVSFGVSEIPRWNRNAVKRGVRCFDSISIREASAKGMVEKFNKNISVECDPTLLFEPEEWRAFYSPITNVPTKYIFVHFINEPSSIAIEAIRELSETNNLDIICFGYDYSSVIDLKRSRFVNGDPREYVALIDNADIICTDSFHSSIFSINLGREFYVFERQYLHSNPQTERITNLLNRYNMSCRLVRNIDQLRQNFKGMIDDNQIEMDRSQGRKYLNNLL